MTCREPYLLARRRLGGAGVDSPGADAAALAQRFLGLDRAGLALHGEEAPPPQREAAFLQAVEERAARRPLQYILGEWEFMGLPLAVGEGVLCPREDTAVLVEELARRLGERPRPRGLDLCAGTGAVALGLRTLLPQAEVLCLELSDRAFPYLEENLRRHGKGTSSPRRWQGSLPPAAWILSPLTPLTLKPGSCPASSRRCGRSPPWPWTAGRTAWCSTGPLPGCGRPWSSPGGWWPWRSARARARLWRGFFNRPVSLRWKPPRTGPAWTGWSAAFAEGRIPFQKKKREGIQALGLDAFFPPTRLGGLLAQQHNGVFDAVVHSHCRGPVQNGVAQHPVVLQLDVHMLGHHGRDPLLNHLFDAL